MAKWLLIDGFNLLYRCYFAVPDLRSPEGFPTNALHGWVKSLWRLQDQEKPAGTYVFFDLGGAQDRLALLPDYKAQREEMPADLVLQIDPTKQLTSAMGCAVIEVEGVESDDLLATKARALAQQGEEVLIVSADKDFAQLVDDRIQILLPPPSANPRLGWRRLDAAGVREKFGVPPSYIADYLALVGDASDNIPGLDGAGPKTVSKWILSYGGLEAILAADAVLEPVRFRGRLAAEANKWRRNLQLTRLNLHLTLPPCELPSMDLGRLLKLLAAFGMKSALGEARERFEQTRFF